jgi:TRAP-type C4-dicarboxylate transport system permease small subunit
MTPNGVLGRLDVLVEATAALLMAALSILVFVGVIYRYVLLAPIAWIEEVVRFCLVWVTFLGTYLGVRRGQHIALEVVYHRLGPRGRRAVDAVGRVLLAAFFAALAWYGARYARAFMGARTPYLGTPQGLTYAALPVGALLLLVALSPVRARRTRPAAGKAVGRP